MDRNTLNSDTILAIIRGDLHISRLDKFHIHIVQRGDAFEFELHEDHPPTTAPLIADIARGLLKYKDNPDDLRQWGRFMMMSSAVDLEPLEEHPSWDMLLDALWDASFDGIVDEQRLGVLRELVGAN